MKLSSSGRIVVIDDERDEVEQLLIALGRNGTPFLYFTGNVGELPITPLTGVRFVILDIELEGMSGQEDKTKASGVAGVLAKVISPENGPFVILFWTQHKEVKELVLDYSKKRGIIPIYSVDLDKAACLNNGGDVITKITAALNTGLTSLGAFQLYVQWENLVDHSCKEFVRNFSSLVPLNARWSATTGEMFYRLYKCLVGKHDEADQQVRFRCACHLMNRSYLDTLEKYADSYLTLPTGLSIDGGTLTDEAMAKLNTSLFLRQPVASIRRPGSVFKINNEPLRTALNKSLFRQESAPTGTILCGLLLTPACDIAQNKTLRMVENDSTVHRVLYGLLYPMSGSFEAEKLKIKQEDSKERIGPIWFEEKPHLLIIHFATISTLMESGLTEDPVFVIGLDWLSDIQRLAASHVNRLGRLSID